MGSQSLEVYHVAIVEDDSVYREYEAMMLESKSFILHLAASGDELEAILDEHPVDCIVMDYQLERETGFALKERLSKSRAEVPPIVMLTGDGSERTVIKALRMGISDYVPKRDLQVNELVSAIRRAVQQGRLEQAKKADYHRLAEESAFDLLTPLFGRTYLDEYLTNLGKLKTSTRSSYGLIFIELAEMRQICDAFGLDVGEKVLRAFGSKLRSLMRSTDICGRFEGHKFLCIMQAGGDARVLSEFCGRLVEEIRFQFDFNGASLQISAFLGAAMCWLSQDPGTDELLRFANDALAKGKASPTRFHVYGAPGGDPAGFANPDLSGSDTLAPAADTLRGLERRQSPRQRVYKRGEIIIAGFESIVSCTVRDVSNTGARLRVSGFFAVPDQFELEIHGSGQRRKAITRWQSGNEVGVEYVA